jgi:acetyl esterase/lipase
VTGVQAATSLPPQCYQALGLGGTSPTNPFVSRSLLDKRQASSTSEDCLFLEYVLAVNINISTVLATERFIPSVFVPKFETAIGLPVVVWIHGGGYVYYSMVNYARVC